MSGLFNPAPPLFAQAPGSGSQPPSGIGYFTGTTAPPARFSPSPLAAGFAGTPAWNPSDPLGSTARFLGVSPQALFNSPALAAQVQNQGLHPQAGRRGGQMPLDPRLRRLRAIKARRARPNVPPPPRVPPEPLDFRRW